MGGSEICDCGKGLVGACQRHAPLDYSKPGRALILKQLIGVVGMRSEAIACAKFILSLSRRLPLLSTWSTTYVLLVECELLGRTRL